jgi:formate-dependent nitrite reductase cytochrome c552 subunit
MTLKEKQLASLKRKIANTQNILNRNSEKLKLLKAELDKAEMEELRSVLTEKGLTVEQVIQDIGNMTNGVVKEQKIQNTMKFMEEKKDVEL